MADLMFTNANSDTALIKGVSEENNSHENEINTLKGGE